MRGFGESLKGLAGKKNLLLFGFFIIVFVLSLIQQKEYLDYTTSLLGAENRQYKRVLPNNQSYFNTPIGSLEVDDNFLTVTGWTNVENKPSHTLNVFLFLKSETDTIIISSIPSERRDVVDALGSNKYLYSGFNVTYPICKLKSDTYKIGFLIEARDTTLVRLSDRMVTIENKIGRSDTECDSLFQMMSLSYLSKLELYFEIVKKALNLRATIGYVGDKQPEPYDQLTYLEVRYCLAPYLLRNDFQGDTVLGYFPRTKNPDHVDNPLYLERLHWKYKDFGNGVLLLLRNSQKD
jgi:hypothetical protein